MAQAKPYLLIDNYDSFTYNLWHFLSELGADVVVHRNNKVTVAECLDAKPAGIILSPGPCDPDRAGICLPLITEAAGKVPLFGVCLGHQAIGQAFGGKVIRARGQLLARPVCRKEVRHGERMHRVDRLSRHAQGLPAGSEQMDFGRGAQDRRRQPGARRGEVLAIIQHNEHLTRAEILQHHLLQRALAPWSLPKSER